MSSTILQSFKIFKLTDGKNSFYIEGSVSESSNDYPKRYDTIWFNAAAKDAETLSLHAINHAHSVVGGCTRLKSGNGISVEDDVHTIIRRYRRNIKLAKEIVVDSISIEKERIVVQFGAGREQLKEAAPGFRFSENDNSIGLIHSKEVEEKRLIDVFLSGQMTVEDALKLVDIDGTFISFTKLSESDSDEDIAVILEATHEFYLPRMIEAWSKVKSEEEILNLMSDEKLDGLSKYYSYSKSCQSIKHKREITRNAAKLNMVLAKKIDQPSKVMKI
jgi:hypothetical protein